MPALGFLQNIGPGEILLILAVLLLLFGATRIPQIARSLGRSASEFKKGIREGAEDESKPADQKKDTEEG